MEAPLDADAVAVEPEELALTTVDWTPLTCLRPGYSIRPHTGDILQEVRAFLAVVLIGPILPAPSAITTGMSAVHNLLVFLWQVDERGYCMGSNEGAMGIIDFDCILVHRTTLSRYISNFLPIFL
jgi:hypothetical protein